MNAYIGVLTKAGQAKKVAQKIGKLAEVKLADCCWGRPDVIVFVEVADTKALDRLVVERIAAVPGVQATDTHLVLGS